MKKYVYIVLLFIMLICPIKVSAQDYKYTLDEANVLKKQTKEYIDNYSEFLYKEKKFKYYIVTLKTLGIYNLEEITEDYYEQLNIGNNGILILYVKDKQSIQILTGAQISHIIDDTILEKHINDYIIPFLKNNEIDQGILNGYKSLYKIVCNYYKIDSTEMEVYHANNFYEKYKSYIIIFLIWINTTTTYFICDTVKKFYVKKKKLSKKDQLIFIISSMVNIIVLFVSYFMSPSTMFLILAFELFAITSSYSTSQKLDLTKIKKMEYKKELKRRNKEKALARKKEAIRLKQLRKMQKEVKKRNKKIKRNSSDLESMLNRSRHK